MKQEGGDRKVQFSTGNKSKCEYTSGSEYRVGEAGAAGRFLRIGSHFQTIGLHILRTGCNVFLNLGEDLQTLVAYRSRIDHVYPSKNSSAQPRQSFHSIPTCLFIHPLFHLVQPPVIPRRRQSVRRMHLRLVPV
jgi:hypothetical protein